MWKSDTCDYSEAYIVVKATINLKPLETMICLENMLYLKIMYHLINA